MTKEITKAFILQQMEDKFKLRELEPERFRFSEMVVPVYNIEQHVEDSVSNYVQISVTSTGGFLFFTVPQNERWTLHRYIPIFMGVTGEIKITGIYVQRIKEISTSAIYLDLKAGQEVSYLVDLPKDVVLDPGDSLHVTVDTYVSTQNLRLYIDYTRETIR